MPGGGAEFYSAGIPQYGPFGPNAFVNSSQFNSVLLVSNLNEEKITCTALFNLFSSYGNVMRVKILHNKPDHALVQMGDYAQVRGKRRGREEGKMMTCDARY
jgi:hypothetical protein